MSNEICTLLTHIFVEIRKNTHTIENVSYFLKNSRLWKIIRTSGLNAPPPPPPEISGHLVALSKCLSYQKALMNVNV